MDEVIVGNIGTVYSGIHTRDAMQAYAKYKRQSMYGHGRASGESVMWMRDGEIYREYLGSKQWSVMGERERDGNPSSDSGEHRQCLHNQ